MAERIGRGGRDPQSSDGGRKGAWEILQLMKGPPAFTGASDHEGWVGDLAALSNGDDTRKLKKAAAGVS